MSEDGTIRKDFQLLTDEEWDALQKRFACQKAVFFDSVASDEPDIQA